MLYIPDSMVRVESSSDPVSLRRLLVKQCHIDTSHGGAAATHYELTRRRVWWANAYDDCSNYVRSRCWTCMKSNGQVGMETGMTLHVQQCPKFMDLIIFDAVGEFAPTATGYKKIISAYEAYSGYCWYIPVRD